MKPIIQKTIVSCFAIGLYVNTISHDFTLDDVAVIANNKYTQLGLNGIPRILSSGYWSGYSTNPNGYRPLSLVTYAIEYELWGNNPNGYHLINVLLYALCGILLLSTLKLLLKDKLKTKLHWYQFIPFVLSLFFIAHPLHTEVVASIKSRDEILSLIGILSTIFFITRYVRTYSVKFLMAGAITFFLALLSKENAITLIGIVPLTLYVFTPVSKKKNIFISSLFLIVALIYMSIRISVVGSIVASSIRVEIIKNSLMLADGIWQQWATAFFVLGKYLKLLLYPLPLAYDYSYNQIPLTDWNNSWVLLSFAIYVVLGMYALLKIGSKSVTAYGILFYIITLSVVSNLIFLIDCTMAERLLFTPSLGFILLIGGIFVDHSGQLKAVWGKYKGLSLISLALLLFLCSWKTISRNNDWKNNYTLFSADIKHTQNSAMAQLFYGLELMEQYPQQAQQFDEAIIHMKKATDIYPKYALAWYGLAITYSKKGDIKKAARSCKTATLLTPDNPAMKNLLADLYHKLGQTYLNQNQLDSAIVYLTETITVNPSYSPEIYNNLGVTFALKKNYEASIAVLNKAIPLYPTYIPLYINLAISYRQNKSYKEAIAIIEKGLKVDSKNQQLHHQLELTYQEIEN